MGLTWILSARISFVPPADVIGIPKITMRKYTDRMLSITIVQSFTTEYTPVGSLKFGSSEGF